MLSRESPVMFAYATCHLRHLIIEKILRQEVLHRWPVHEVAFTCGKQAHGRACLFNEYICFLSIQCSLYF